MIKSEIELSKLNGLFVQLHLFKFPKGITFFVQGDFDMWRIPKIIKSKSGRGYSCGWLFLQIGYLLHNGINK